MFQAISSQTAFFGALILLAIGACGSLVLSKKDSFANWFGNGFAILASLSGLYASLSVLIEGNTFSRSFSSTLPALSVSFSVDRLSAFFVFVISLVVLFASIYGLGYVKHFYGKYNLGTLGFFYNAFLAGILMVFTAHQAVFFLIAWEIMSLASYCLVIYENKERENVKAGTLYFVMTHIGTAFILVAFLLMYHATGSLDFGVIKASAASIPALVKDAIFICALIGFGIKAGIIPLHIWLPSAHPAAPTHVSAIMSGVMIKSGIYMFMRVFLDILPQHPVWWGVLVLLIGAISSLLGVLYALTEHDIKRLLAYHSIENIGIILLGLGSAMIFLSSGMSALAMLALVASLFHTVNHAIFKALLFLGAGSVITKTHTRNIEEYGGLIKLMPLTGFFFLIGSMAISALPPFNGFFSEWMTYQSLFSGIASFGFSVRWVFMLAAGSLAFTGGLAAACFVKAFSATFLARPRSEEVKHAKESDSPLVIAMGALAVLTLVLGVCAGTVSNILLGVVKNLSVFSGETAAFVASRTQVSLTNGFSTVSMPLVLLGLLIALVFTLVLVNIISRKQKTVIARTWDCGTDLTPRMEMTATGFSRSIVTIFQGILKPTKQTSIEYRDADMRYFQKSNTIHLGIEDIYGRFIYKPLQTGVTKISEKMKKIQSGNVNMYVLYIFLILIALMLFLVI